MTKADLLAELISFDWCDYVGDPGAPVETKPDGTNWYIVNIRDVSGKTAVYRNVSFYVIDEGGAGESALYKDAEPSETQNRASALKQWILNAVDANPTNYKGIQILWISERWEMVIYTILTGTPLVQKTFYVRKNNGAPAEIENFNIDLLRSIT
jgi:hypothetical protein